MATVKILLDEHETIEEAQESLLKALVHHDAGEEHKAAFHQPAARDVFETMIKEHDAMWDRILKEINGVLEEEVS